MMRIFFAGLFMFFNLSSGFGQRFLHLTSNDGLPDNHARFVYQDVSGYIYVGTRSGLSRYDGYNFSLASIEDSDSSVPKEFSAMIETDNNYFTIASSGIYSYSKYNNSLKLSKKMQVLDEACFIKFDGKIYCGNSAGLFVYEDQTEQWINCNQYVSGINNIHVRTMLVTSYNELLLGTNKGFFRFGVNMELLETDIGNDPAYHNINGIIQDNQGGYWFSTFTNLYHRDKDFEKTGNYNSLFADKHIRCLEMDQESRLWVGGEFGIVILDTQTDITTELYRDNSLNQGLNDNAIYSIFRDRADNMWVGTYFGGINLWNGSFDKFKTYFPGSNSKSLSGKVVREMQEDSSGNLWLALEDGGLNYLNLKTGDVSRFFFQKENEYKNVHSLILDDDKLWVGSFNNGLECFKISFNNEEPHLTRTASYLEDKMIFSISMSTDKKIYAGTVAGIYVLNLVNGDISAYNEEIFSNRMVYTIKCISNKELLAGTLRNGLYHCNIETSVTATYSREKEFAAMQVISSIHRLDSGRFTITCSSGLYIFNNNDKSLKCILPSEGVTEFRSVLIDNSDNYWVSTTNGLIYFNPDSGIVKRYNMYNGLPENQFNFNSAFRTSENHMFFGTYNGLISFVPEKLKSFENTIPEVSFTSYTVVGEDGTTLNSHYLDNETTELRLKPYQTFLSLEFSTLGYTRSKDLNYEIRMAGKGVSWEQMKSNRSVTFTHLSKGWHQVEVRSVSEGIIYGPSRLLKIYRKPSVWQTGYAYVLYSLVLIFILLFARRDFLNRQKAKHIHAIEQYEKENQKMLNDQKMRFFLNISHEFRTPLAIIGGTISNIMLKFNVGKEVEKKLQTIQKTSDNLNNLVNDFLDYGKLNSGFKPLELKKEQVLHFVEKTCNMFDNWAEANQLSYEKNIQQIDATGYFDLDKLERVIYNLLSNAFKFNKSHGSVVVEASIQKDSMTWLSFSVKDTGPGISEELCAEIRKHFNKDSSANLSDKSIGLAYTAGLVHQMEGKLEVESDLGSGSQFTVYIPVDKPDNDYILDASKKESVVSSYFEDSRDKELKTLMKEEIRPTILIIDDNEELLAMLRDSLETEYNTLTTSSPKKALSMVLQNEITLIICDIMMPEMDGFEVIEALQSNILTSHVPIIILTAAAEKNIELKGYKKGAVSYLAKPYRNEELFVKIESILSFRRELISRFHSEHEVRYEDVVCSKKDEQFIKRAVGVVHEHIDKSDFDVDQFCSAMNVSRTLLHTKLKNLTAMSTTEFLRNIRLRQAYIYLKKDSLSVAEVALKCGFNDANYFSKCFKKMYKVFPSKL